MASLELQTRFAGSVGHFFDAAVIDEPVAVKDNRGDLLGEQLLADDLPDLTRLGLLRSRERIANARLEIARRREHAARDVVDRLRVDMLRRAEHAQPRTLRSTDRKST